MISFNSVIFLLFLVAAVVPEFVPGVSSSSLAIEETLSSAVNRQPGVGAAACSGICYRRPRRARRECRRGLSLGLNCDLGRCNLPTRANPGFVCRFISGPITAPTVAVPTVVCPNRCFAPGNSAPATIQAALSSAQADCRAAPPPCAVRGCPASPVNGFSCSLPIVCPNVCQISPQVAAQECASAPGCTTVSCALPGGATGTACAPPPAPGAITAAAASPSASPSMSIGASPSPTSSVTPSPAASISTTPSPTPTPSTTVSPSPSPGCTFIGGNVGTTAVTGICRCGTDTATVSIPGFVDDAGMALSVANEIPGGTAYTTCLARDLAAACNPNGFSSFSTSARTAAVNCCTGSVVDGMGLNTATNQCRIGDGCQAVMVPPATSLIGTGERATCMCTSDTEMVALRQITASGGAAADLTTTPVQTAINAYQMCLVRDLAPLCTSAGVGTFSTAAVAVVDACCTAAAPGGAGPGTPPTGTQCQLA